MLKSLASLSALAVLSVTLTARADYFPGKVLNNECSRSVTVQGGPPIASICFAKKLGVLSPSGEPQQFLMLRLPNNKQVELTIVAKRPVNAGMNPTARAYEFTAVAPNGTQAQGRVQLAQISQEGATRTVVLDMTYAGARISAGEFQFAVNTM